MSRWWDENLNRKDILLGILVRRLQEMTRMDSVEITMEEIEDEVGDCTMKYHMGRNSIVLQYFPASATIEGVILDDIGTPSSDVGQRAIANPLVRPRGHDGLV